MDQVLDILCFHHSGFLLHVFIQEKKMVTKNTLIHNLQCLQSEILGHRCSSQLIVILFFLTSLLEYNCFTMLCQFLLYNKMNQLNIYIYPHISSLLSLPPTLPIPPLQVVTKHRADLPVLCSCFPLAIQLHLVVYICQCHSLTSSKLTLPPPHVLKSFLYICIFIPVLPLGSSWLFFFPQIPYICVSILYLFFSF